MNYFGSIFVMLGCIAMSAYFSAEGRRDRPADKVHPAGNVPDRADRRACHAAGVLPRLWMARDLDGGISLHLRLL